VDQPLENPNPNAATQGHGHGRHGHQTTPAQQQDRIRTGRTPDGEVKPAGTASRFRSPQAEAEALGRGRTALQNKLKDDVGLPRNHPDAIEPSHIDPATGDRLYFDQATGRPARVPVDVRTNNPGGFADSREVAQRTGGPSSPYVLDASGNRIPITEAGPIPTARVVWEYVPSAREWRLLTYFPGS